MRIFRFVDCLGHELYNINDPEEKLPIPAIQQVVSIGPDNMRVELVIREATDVYRVSVRAVPVDRA